VEPTRNTLVSHRRENEVILETFTTNVASTMKDAFEHVSMRNVINFY